MKLTLLFLLFAFGSSAQPGPSAYNMVKPTADNFRRAMALAKPSALQIDSIISLSIEYSYISEDTCLILGARAVAASKDQPDQPIRGRALLELGDSYRIFGRLQEAKELIEEGKAIYQSLEEERQVAYANNKLGALSQNKGDYEAAARYYLDALETAKNLRDSSNIINTSLNIGLVFNILKRLDKAEEYNGQALALAKTLKDEQAEMYALNNQGLIFRAVADRYSNTADSIPLKSALYRDSVRLFLDKSLESHERSMALAEKRNNTQSVIRSLVNVAETLDEKGDFAEALKRNMEADRLIKEVGDVILAILVKRNFAEIYRHSGQYEAAISYGEEALTMAKKNEMEGYIAGANDQLYQAYKAVRQYDKALANYENLQGFRKKNDAADKNKAIAEIEARYQNVQKEKQILELEFVNATIEKQRNYLLGGALLFCILGFFGFQLNKTRKERNDKRAFAEALIFAQEEERKRIARDLHDGVGQSLLLLRKQMFSTQQATQENQKMITETLEEVRSISRDLHPFQLEKFGLAAAIEEAIRKVEQSAGLFITTEIDNIDNLITAKAEINVYRTIQEALNNIVKHAGATAAKVSIRSIGNNIAVKIFDNGQGFDHELPIARSKSLGLRTMQERISNIGGKFNIERNAPSGTIVAFSFPKDASL